MFHVKHLPRAAPERPCVRVVLPAGAIRPHDRTEFDAGLALLERHGFTVRFDTRRLNDRWRDYYAGDDTQRTQEFIDALQEPDVDIIWFGRGGSGSARILPAVLDAAAVLPPRIIVGFSDATAVLNAFAVRLGWLTFHGPVVKSLARADVDLCRAILQGDISSIRSPGTPVPTPNTSPQSMIGRLFGGNLATLSSLAGTSYCPPSQDTIWLLEEIGEYDYRVDRALHHLRDAGYFQDAVGALLGPIFQGTAQPERVQTEIGLPCWAGAPIGHTGPMSVLPIGATVRVEPGRIVGTHPWVQRTEMRRV